MPVLCLGPFKLHFDDKLIVCKPCTEIEDPFRQTLAIPDTQGNYDWRMKEI